MLWWQIPVSYTHLDVYKRQKLNDFSLKEWMQFAYRFAGHVNYFNNLNFEEIPQVLFRF